MTNAFKILLKNKNDVHAAQRLSPLEMKSATRVQVQDETVCVSLRGNSFGEGMNPSILPAAMGSWADWII